jgi:very-short-patch-repair endonuclease
VRESSEHWRKIAAQQGGLITRAQLAALGIERWVIARRVNTERWQALSPSVIATTTGNLDHDQLLWHAVLHAGPDALVGGLMAAELAGLRNWQRDVITAFTPYARGRISPIVGVEFVRTRRDLGHLRARQSSPARMRLEPAILLFASAEPSERAALGSIAATVQQQLTSPQLLLDWLDRLRPLRRAGLFERTLHEIAGGSHSMGELDVARMCRAHRLASPRRQVRRRDASGRLRFTDCEWLSVHGGEVVLEVDGAFHMNVDGWEDDIARQRALTATGRLIVRCTTRELRDESERVALDLIRLGVPRS